MSDKNKERIMKHGNQHGSWREKKREYLARSRVYCKEIESCILRQLDMSYRSIGYGYFGLSLTFSSVFIDTSTATFHLF